MTNRYFYKDSFRKFVDASEDVIFGQIALMDEGDSVSEQKYAWSEEIRILQQVVQPWKNENAEIICKNKIK